MLGGVKRAEAPYALVGEGRMARHWAYYLDQLGVSFSQFRRSDDSLSHLFNQGHLYNFQSIFLAVSDGAIINIAEQLRASGLSYQKLFHFSGHVYSPDVVGLHPLAAFSEGLFAKEFYAKIPFVIDCSLEEVRSALPILENPLIEIAPDRKKTYHAHCVMAGNFSTLLWMKMRDFVKEFGMERQHLEPYMQTVTQNLLNADFPLTGPLVRGDQDTIEEHLEVLKEDPFLNVYKSFCEAYKSQYRR